MAEGLEYKLLRNPVALIKNLSGRQLESKRYIAKVVDEAEEKIDTMIKSTQ